MKLFFGYKSIILYGSFILYIFSLPLIFVSYFFLFLKTCKNEIISTKDDFERGKIW